MLILTNPTSSSVSPLNTTLNTVYSQTREKLEQDHDFDKKSPITQEGPCRQDKGSVTKTFTDNFNIVREN